VTARGSSDRWQRRALHDGTARVAAAFLLLIGLVALFAPLIATQDPLSGQLRDALQGPSAEHWLGTDHLGRDEFSRLVYGARISLLAGLEVLVIALLIGVPLGLIAGYRQGWFDRIGMRVVEVVVALPALLVAIAVVAATGPGLFPSMLAIGFVGATIMARLTRSVVLAEREEDYVDGARVSGAPDRRIITRHLLPNIAPALVVQATLVFAAAVLAEAALSYLGLGASPPQPSWGVMLNEARAQFDQAPMLAVWPGLCIFLTVLALNQLGDRTADVFGRGRVAALDSRPIELALPAAESEPDSSASLALALTRVSVTFGTTEVVSDVSLNVVSGEILGLLGESGAGKTTTALTALGLVPAPGRTHAESVRVAGIELVGMASRELCHVRGRHIGYVAQEPSAALNPTYTVGHQIAEPLRWHLGRSRRQARAEARLACTRRHSFRPGR
jgi:peptide/nickel transport system permease protein